MARRILWILGVFLVGCGGNTDSGGGSGGAGGSSGNGAGGSSGSAGSGTGGSSGSAGSGGVAGNAGNAGTSGSGGGPSGCPALEPGNGATCDAPNLRCTYGESIRPECRDEWLCLGNLWVTTRALCADPPPGTCPAAAPASGGVCPKEGAVCAFDDGTLCSCSSCAGLCGPPPPRWHCSLPPSGAGCPRFVPNDGTRCDAPGVVCQYGDPCASSGAIVQCEGGAWAWQQAIACPA